MFPALRRTVSSPKIFLFDPTHLDDLAQRHSPDYYSAQPFPHTVIENFLPEDVADALLDAFPKPDAPNWLDWRYRDTEHQPKKQGIGSAEQLAGASPYIQQVLMAFNSSPVLNFLEKLTGIPHLLPDPHLRGGGLHQILPGGKLAIHSDFNYIDRLQLYRRINLLVYLNKDWKDEYGGHLELWDPAMTHCVKKVAPLFNRCVIFNTDLTSFHGHPEPLTCPPDRTRKSLALYYYTSQPGESSGGKKVVDTLWQKRPGDED